MSSLPDKSEWLVFIPDFPDAGGRRNAVFHQHIERRKSDPEDFWVLGGATLKEPMSAGQPPNISGSAMIVFAPTKESIVARLEDDPLVKERVWDLEHAQIHAFFRPKRVPV